MQQYITGIRVANDVMMLRRQHRGSIVIVEGPSDARFYHKHFSQEKCRIIPAYCKANVIQAICELINRSAVGVLAIVDTDYWYLEGRIPSQNNLVFTDTHDIETLLILSPALDNIIRESIPIDRFVSLNAIAQRVRQSLLEIGLQIGYLRWTSFRENLGLNFESLPIDQILNRKPLMIDFNRMLQAAKVASKCARIPFTDDDIKTKIHNLETKNANPWHVCQGHDLVCILEFILPIVVDEIIGKDAAGSLQKKSRVDRLHESLRLAYDKSYFVTTNLYTSIKQWESRNSPFIIVDDNG